MSGATAQANQEAISRGARGATFIFSHIKIVSVALLLIS
jgi:hypothetical protein